MKGLLQKLDILIQSVKSSGIVKFGDKKVMQHGNKKKEKRSGKAMSRVAKCQKCLINKCHNKCTKNKSSCCEIRIHKKKNSIYSNPKPPKAMLASNSQQQKGRD